MNFFAHNIRMCPCVGRHSKPGKPHNTGPPGFSCYLFVTSPDLPHGQVRTKSELFEKINRRSQVLQRFVIVHTVADILRLVAHEQVAAFGVCSGSV